MSTKSIYVTQPSLPPLDEFVELLKGVWDSGILTHNGPLVQRFESEICELLGIDNFITTTNGTIAIQMAIKALELKGEIITTPFTWVATISAIKWEGCTPVFCDIDPGTLNIDPSEIEAAITDKTVAIMPVHVFGNPCDVVAIEKIANKYDLKVIYDAAHAIGSKFNDKSLLTYGDISATSLHGTKLLNTAEGGGCYSSDPNIIEKLKRIRFFGHNDQKELIEDGFNGKMTEVHAALGLANLKYYHEVIDDRKSKYFYYKKAIKDVEGLYCQVLSVGETNYSYFPVLFVNEMQLLTVERELNKNKIFPRRYFYPSLNTCEEIVEYVSMPISEDISSRVLCLPLYKNLKFNEIDMIIKVVLSTLANLSN